MTIIADLVPDWTTLIPLTLQQGNDDDLGTTGWGRFRPTRTEDCEEESYIHTGLKY